MSLLEVRSVSKRYGALTALDGVDLSVEASTFHGLIGPNGSGKSTLLKCIAGAEMADGGSISLFDREVTHAVPVERARAGLSMKFQLTSVFPQLPVYDNVLLALQARSSIWSLVRSRSRRGLHQQIMTILAQFRLSGRANDLAGVLSHGEQQWLEIAMALAPGPKLLLLDEPTAGMSPEERRLTGELLAPVRETCALVIVEHDVDFIKDLCDVLTVLYQGQVLDVGTAAQIQASERVKKVYLTRV